MEKLILKKKKNQWGEYKIRYYRNDKEIEEGSYYTDDWEDAINSFKHMANCLKLEWMKVYELNLITGKSRFKYMITK